MSVRDGRLPTTTGRAVALAAAVGTIALAGFEPLAIAGGLVGCCLAATVSLFGGSYRRVTAGSALFPPLALAGVVAVGLAAAPIPAVLTVAATILGTFAVGVAVGRPTPATFLRTGAAALCGAIFSGAAALLALGLDSASGPRPTLEAVVWLAGDGATGLAVAIVAASVAVAVAIFLVPPAAVTDPSGRDSYRATRNALATATALLTALALAGLGTLTVLSWYVPPIESFAERIVDDTVVRGPIALVTWSAVGVAVFAAVVRGSWVQTDGHHNAIVPLVVGSLTGVALPFAGTIAVGGADAALAAVLFGATAVALGVVWLVAWLYEGALIGDITAVPSPVTVVAAALAVCGVVTGASTDVATLDLETIRAGTATFVALAAALFAYDVGRYGRALARDVGVEASRRTQLVRLGWCGAIAAVGVLVAALGLAVAAVLAPMLSIPATAGVLAAVIAVVTGAWSLLR